MNVVDSEVVVAIMQKQDYELTDKPERADLILVNTCSIRDNAESRVRARLRDFASMKKKQEELKIGVIGCMAERLKEQLIDEERSVDLVIGPDAYRELPALLTKVEQGEKGINTQLSLEETYDNISPVRLDENHVSAFVSIMRGCNNFCAYCVVPYTRGRERSRDPRTILGEVRELLKKGYKEVTLLGQNVNSYSWTDPENNEETGFEKLLASVAEISPELRVRFATSHPKDMSDELLQTIAKYTNLCKSIHLPVQSGSTTVLKRMKRGYTREMYMDRISAIRKYLPDASISTDIIAGFCGETEEEHRETLALMEWAGFDFAFMFKYSERPDTLASKKYVDDVSEADKTRRLNEIIALQNKLSLKSKEADKGKTFDVLIEGTSKKSAEKLFGRTSQNKVVVFPGEHYKTGNYVNVYIERCTSATLIGHAIKR